MAQEFDALLARIDDPALRDDLRRSFDKVRAKRTFGLVFESHLPERVTLPSYPIRRGVRVTRRDDQRQVFFVGTAVEVTPVRSVDKVRIADGHVGPVTRRIQKAFFEAVNGEVPDTHGWLTYVYPEEAGLRQPAAAATPRG